ncbi:hypothetical protein BG011_004895 [Mortierella polycephala]|uniref:Ubiquitin-like domain-containing protein n=1 Tax=Mortierella polycephala TaxID=41804 RepID=A0A9P6QGD4_9FUNG|nr:hypothetical protein BG011_004895 [Mortierella polycephala]
MDPWTIEIHSHATSFTAIVAVSRQWTVLHLKEVIRQRLETPPPVAADIDLVYNERNLEDSDVLAQVDFGVSTPRVDLSVSPLLQTVDKWDSEACSPATVHIRETESNMKFLKTGSAVGDLPGTGAKDRNTAETVADLHKGHFAGQQSNVNSKRERESQTGHHIDPVTPVSHTSPCPTIPRSYQYAIVNGMPYLIPMSSLPLLHHQHNIPGGYISSPMLLNPDGTMARYPHASVQQQRQQQQQQQQTGAAAVNGMQENIQENARRDQRRAASLWLFLKLVFGVYIFSQNGSFERIVLLHLAALIIFLHQTGRLRIVRRVAQDPPRDPAADGGNQNASSTASNTATGHTNSASTSASASLSLPLPSESSSATTSTAAESASLHKEPQGEGMEENAREKNEDLTTSHTKESTTPSSLASEKTETIEGSSSLLEENGTQEHTQNQLQGEEAPGQEHQHQRRVSTWRYVEHALLTFITSLIPAPPPEIDPAAANAAAAGERAM